MPSVKVKTPVQILLGPAGSGKTHHCLEAIRTELKARPQGPPLLLLAPKQATFQMEHSLLQDPKLHGYTRLQILSFERLAEFVLSEFNTGTQSILSEEGRVMVLRSILNQVKDRLRIFRASTKLPGLARELSGVIREFQQSGIPPESLLDLSDSKKLPVRVSQKLHDIGLVFGEYKNWIQQRELFDPDHLLDLAADTLQKFGNMGQNKPSIQLGGIWMDGFAALTTQERHLLLLLAPLSQQTTLAFCADSFPEGEKEIFSIWLPVHQTIRQCIHEFNALESVDLKRKILNRSTQNGRFKKSPMLAWLESKWTRPEAMLAAPDSGSGADQSSQMELSLSQIQSSDEKNNSIEISACRSPEAESVYVARKILKRVREGGIRFNEIAVLVRSLPHYQEIVRHTFERYQIPCFIDRRESVSHHPLVELSRCALRLPGHGWAHEEWFTYLKTGLTDISDSIIDDLENAAIENGWRGVRWWKPLRGPEDLTHRFEPIRKKLIKPFKKFLQVDRRNKAFEMPPPWNGIQLANAYRTLWDALNVEERLEQWDKSAPQSSTSNFQEGFHVRVLNMMEEWLSNIELAFAEIPLPIREWIPIVDTGLANLTIGVIPPAIDQVLVGAIDRSRNPDLKATFLMGLNETIFPAKPANPSVFDEQERLKLEDQGVHIGSRYRTQLATERFLGYIGCTRSTDYLSLSYSLNNSEGKIQTPSVFIQHIKRLFPQLEVESFDENILLNQALHERELLVNPDFWYWQKSQSKANLSRILPALSARELFDGDAYKNTDHSHTRLDEIIAKHLYSDSTSTPALYTSVSRIEAFAECPFRFFVQSGLKAEERMAFELDPRRLGSFQHAALESFHMALEDEGLKWHDLTPIQAREYMEQITQRAMKEFHDGLMEDRPVNRITAMALGQALGTFIEVVVEWMAHYAFEPFGVEIAFGGKQPRVPAWEIELPQKAKMVFSGIIDRVDLYERKDQPALAIVIDYKSGQKKPDAILSWNGIQLQLPVYLNVLNQSEIHELVHDGSIQAVGAFFTTLRSKYEGKSSRLEALHPQTARESVRKAYQHTGCFDLSALPWMDQREGATRGEQFQYQLNKDGLPYKSNWHAMSPSNFQLFLNHTTQLLKSFGIRIFEGEKSISPYRQGQKTPCMKCDYASVCRIDPWTQEWRQLEPSGYGIKQPSPES